VEHGTRRCPTCKKSVSISDDLLEVDRKIGESYLVLHLRCPACGHLFDAVIDSD
jgi:predicted Zn finger-like uncharacterized protein